MNRRHFMMTAAALATGGISGLTSFGGVSKVESPCPVEQGVTGTLLRVDWQKVDRVRWQRLWNISLPESCYTITLTFTSGEQVLADKWSLGIKPFFYLVGKPVCVSWGDGTLRCEEMK